MDRFYTPNPDGYCGDEDNGQTSAWYVFSALGFYPVCPASDQYVLGTPYFDSVTLNLENGRKVTINAQGNSADAPYISSMRINGSDYTRNYIDHATLMGGANIDFSLSQKPNFQRGTSADDAPYSFSRELKKKK